MANNHNAASQQRKAVFYTLLCLGAVVFVMLSYVGYQISREGKKAFMARDITTASHSCEEKIISHFGKRLAGMRYDSMSSRYDKDIQRYLVYFRIDERKMINDLPVINERIAKCTIWEFLGYVSDFQIIDL